MLWKREGGREGDLSFFPFWISVLEYDIVLRKCPPLVQSTYVDNYLCSKTLAQLFTIAPMNTVHSLLAFETRHLPGHLRPAIQLA